MKFTLTLEFDHKLLQRAVRKDGWQPVVSDVLRQVGTSIEQLNDKHRSAVITNSLVPGYSEDIGRWEWED